MLQSFCILINRSVADSLLVFGATQFVNSEVLPQWQFAEQVQLLIDAFTNTTSNEFTRMFALIQNTTSANQFINVPNSNANLEVMQDGQVQMTAHSLSILDFNNPRFSIQPCSCNGGTSNCAQIMVIFDNVTQSWARLPGLYIGCLLMDGIMFSTLQCWFNSSCLNIINEWLFQITNTNINITPLDINLPSRFSPRTPINQLMNELFLENWIVNISYEKFYSSCAPKTCAYTKKEQYDIFYTILTIVAIFSSLSKGLKILVL